MRTAELAGRRVAVWGHGREGRAALAALQARLPGLRPTLFCSAIEAPDVAAASVGTIVTDAPTAADLCAFDVVIKSPGISAYRPELLEARRNGTQFTSGTALWFAEMPQARVIAVTGTKGKSTLSALVAHLLRALGRRTALAGNIGLPLLELLDPAQAPDWWVVELSSFQTGEANGVEVGVVNNLYEEHLDWHGTRERYAADKLALADAARTLVLNALQPELLARTATHPRRVTFGDAQGWHAREGWIRRGAHAVFELARSPLPGAHNALNACAALATLEAAGVDAVAAAPAIATFRPLPHRLQLLGERDGIDWIDDSIATTPQATLEALASLRGRDACVLVGGYERGLDWTSFARALDEQPPHAVVTMGANGARIAQVLRACSGRFRLASVATLAEAVTLARSLVPRGGAVLLSPGAPSFDQFRDYAERGCAFARLAGFDPAAIGVIDGLGIA
ncbi:MAG: UDP-N-acetylmuramoyl-L-alanine--D-glutamate ligase [Lysobacteraceae bacterium]|nr:MAG: UDP-N-acetylmuramoyl-L-alanine--D-glutamate ligase [Xanthomonadaceae bacterium]